MAEKTAKRASEDAVEKVARAIYESHELVRPWEHPRTQQLWRYSCMRSARAALSAMPQQGWREIASAPRDGTPVLFGGRWRPFDILAGGRWHQQIFSWTTLMSDGTGHKWLSSDGFAGLDHWNVDWTHWQPLPSPPSASAQESRDG